MFAQRHWFATASRIPWPVHWKAWAYFATLGAFLAIPWMILIGRGHFPESLAWPWVVAALAVWDLRSMLRRASVPHSLTSPGTFPGSSPRTPAVESIETPNFVVRRR